MRKFLGFIVSSVIVWCSPALARGDIFWHMFQPPVQHRHVARSRHSLHYRIIIKYILVTPDDGRSLDIEELKDIRNNLNEISRKLKDRHDAPAVR